MHLAGKPLRALQLKAVAVVVEARVAVTVAKEDEEFCPAAA